MLDAYGLTENPFPIAAQGPVRNWAGHVSLRDDLMELIRGPRAKDIGISEFAVLHGDLGAGKSHALLYLKTAIEDNEHNEFDAEVVYVERPKVSSKTSFQELVQYIFHNLGQETVINDIGTKVCLNFDSVVKKKMVEAGFSVDDDQTSFVSKAMADFPEEDQAMIKLLRDGQENQDGVYEFLTGTRTCPSDAYKGKKLDSEFVAAKVLGAFIRVATREFPGGGHACEAFYLFVDEFELVLEMKNAESDSLFSGFRELINEVPYRFCLLWSFSASAALIEAVVPSHLMKRMTRSFVEIPSLGDDEAKQFLLSQIKAFHNDSVTSESEGYPFSDEALEYIVQHAESTTPRDLFLVARRVLQRAIKREELEPGQEITQDMAKFILQPYL